MLILVYTMHVREREVLSNVPKMQQSNFSSLLQETIVIEKPIEVIDVDDDEQRSSDGSEEWPGYNSDSSSGETGKDSGGKRAQDEPWGESASDAESTRDEDYLDEVRTTVF